MRINSSPTFKYQATAPSASQRVSSGLARGAKDAFVSGCTAAAVGGLVTNIAMASRISGASPLNANSALAAAYGAAPSAMIGAVVGGLVGGVLGAVNADSEQDFKTSASIGSAAGILCGTSAGLFLGTLGHPATYILHAFGA